MDHLLSFVLRERTLDVLQLSSEMRIIKDVYLTGIFWKLLNCWQLMLFFACKLFVSMQFVYFCMFIGPADVTKHCLSQNPDEDGYLYTKVIVLHIQPFVKCFVFHK